MKALIESLNTNTKYAKVFEWGKLITITGSAQIMIQVISFICGILVIRMLPTQDYAFYTLANTMLGTMVILADGGIAAGVMSQGGKVWQDPKKLGVVLITGLSLRKRFGIITLIITLPILLYLLLEHGASWLFSFFIILSLIPAFFASLSDSLLEVAPKLKQDVASLQKNQVAANIGRLLLTGILIFIFPYSFVAVIAAGLPRVWANVKLRKVVTPYADLYQNSDKDIRKEILAFVKKMLPEAIYFCVSGQITIWLISILGSTSSIAEIGALGRLAMILNFFTVLFATLIYPRFARLPNNKNNLLTRFIQIFFIAIIINICIITFVYLFSSQILWILGPSYLKLNNELVLNIIGSCVNLMTAVFFNLSTNRGWAINPIILIPVSIASIVLGVVIFDLSSLKGVLFLNIFTATVQMLLNGIYCFKMILKVK